MKYPLYKHARDTLKLPGGRPVTAFSLEELTAGKLRTEDLGIHEDVLRAQAKIAEQSGFPQLAMNLSRAAEMTRIPEEEILDIYEALRPGRCRPEDLESLARKVEETHDAPLTGAFLREAATVLRSIE